MKVRIDNGIYIKNAHKDISKWEFAINGNETTKIYIRVFLKYAIGRLVDILCQNKKFSKRALRKHIRKLISQSNGTSFDIYVRDDNKPHRLEMWVNVNSKDINKLELENSIDLIGFVAKYNSDVGICTFMKDAFYYVDYDSYITHTKDGCKIKQRISSLAYRSLWSENLFELYSYYKTEFDERK